MEYDPPESHSQSQQEEHGHDHLLLDGPCMVAVYGKVFNKEIKYKTLKFIFIFY